MASALAFEYTTMAPSPLEVHTVLNTMEYVEEENVQVDEDNGKRMNMELEEMFKALNLTLALDKNHKCLKASDKLVCLYYIAMTFNLTDIANLEAVQATANQTLIENWFQKLKQNNCDTAFYAMIVFTGMLSAVGCGVLINLIQNSCRKIVADPNKYKVVRTESCICENVNKFR